MKLFVQIVIDLEHIKEILVRGSVMVTRLSLEQDNEGSTPSPVAILNICGVRVPARQPVFGCVKPNLASWLYRKNVG